MSAKPCPLLQSGFAAFSDTVLTKPETNTGAALVSALKTGKINPVSNNPYFFSQEATDLFQEYLTNTNSLSSFEFREKILKLAFKLMSPKKQPFVSWVRLQFEVPNLSHLHYTFLKDTLEYLASVPEAGRSVEMESWQSLLLASGSSKKETKTEFNVEKYFSSEKSSFASTFFINPIPVPMHEVLVRWVSKTKGFRDLLMFLFIVYGKKQSSIGGYNA